jgi:hypothetical protein
MKTSIEISGKNYIFDLDRAKELGLCKEAPEFIEACSGDVYKAENVKVLIVEVFDKTYAVEHRYQILGLNGMEAYSDYGRLLTAQELSDFLFRGKYEFAANINNNVHRLIENACFEY